MAQMDSASALVTSIGEYTVDSIGRDKLLGLSVKLDPRTMQGDMRIALANNTDEVQKDVIRDIFEVEAIYADEAVLTFHFVNGPDEVDASPARENAPIYAYA